MPKTSRRHQLATDDSGQTLTEYALIASAVVLVGIAVLPLFAGSITGFFSAFAQAFGG